MRNQHGGFIFKTIIILLLLIILLFVAGPVLLGALGLGIL